MSGRNLGKLSRTGKLNAQNPLFAGGWSITFAPSDLGIKIDCEVYHAAVKGPTGSRFQVYIDDVFYDNVAHGDVNSWDPTNPMFVRPGDSVLLHYSTAASPAPVATLFFRQIAVI